MKNLNQRGFVTLETLLILGAFAILATVTVPQMARVLDKVALNYEMKSLYSELNLARALGKSATFTNRIFTTMENGQHSVEIWIYGKNYSNVSARNRYQIKRTSLTSENFYRHNLENSIALELTGDQLKKIDFEKLGGRQQTITLKSKYNDEAYIMIDSVGRVRGDYDKK